jgi:16S rRNA (adenine1518-N6/adenine1519-N6)-dimethyltransferase
MTLTEVRELLADLEISPRKALGQNFLIDQNIRHIILDEADVQADETVLEIGPGLGTMTEVLAKCAGRVVAIEKDRQLCRYLEAQFPRLELIKDDAVKVLRAANLSLGRGEPPARPRRRAPTDEPAARPYHTADKVGRLDLPDSFKVVANLPYNISTPVLEQLVEGRHQPRKMVLTLQREVVERLAALPRTKEYGALTLFTQLRYHVTIVHIVSATCFYPEPGVQSAVVALDRREPRVALVPGAPFHELVRQGFGQRRKMLRNHLTGFDNLDRAFAAAGVLLTARAEELSLDQWITVANAVSPKKSD